MRYIVERCFKLHSKRMLILYTVIILHTVREQIDCSVVFHSTTVQGWRKYSVGVKLRASREEGSLRRGLYPLLRKLDFLRNAAFRCILHSVTSFFIRFACDGQGGLPLIPALATFRLGLYRDSINASFSITHDCAFTYNADYFSVIK